MRIIKFEEMQNISAAIAPMIFADLEEEGGNGAGLDYSAATEMELEKARREADKLRIDAANEAENIMQSAREDVAAMRQQLAMEQAKMREDGKVALEESKKEGFSAGYSSGEEAGYKKGYDDGYGKGKNAAMDETRGTINMMGEVLEQLKAYHSQILEDSQADIARMAISVAKKILQKEIMTDPMTVAGVVKGALSKVAFKKHFIIHVNPLDLEVIQSSGPKVKEMLINAETIQFKASPQVEAGGCIVQTEAGTVDAQISRQVSEVEQAIMTAMGE